MVPSASAAGSRRRLDARGRILGRANPTSSAASLAAWLAVIALALGLAACGAALPEPALHDIAQVQSAIEQTVERNQHVRGTAYCPTDVPAIKGQVFSCIVALPSGPPAIFRVTVETAQGFVDYVRTR